MSVASATKAVQKTIEQLHEAGGAAPARRKGIIEKVVRKTIYRDAKGRIESIVEESGELPGV